MYQIVCNKNHHNHASVQNDYNLYKYPTCYFISEKHFHLQPCSGSVDFWIYFEIVFKWNTFSFNFNKFASNSIEFILWLIFNETITTTHPIKMISIFIDTIHVTSFQKNICIFSLPMVSFISAVFWILFKFYAIFINFQSICFKLKQIHI